MVVLSDVIDATMSIPLPDNKRSLDHTDDEPGNDPISEDTPAPKKIKRNEAEEKILEELKNCQEILDQNKLPDKIIALTEFFKSLTKNNVNTLILKEDFSGWAKDCIIKILDETKKVSDDLLEFLTSALKVAPTVFEPLLEKVLTLCFFFPRKNFTIGIYDQFMTTLVGVFERLRRFPKFIAKLLCCGRDYLIANESLPTQSKSNKRKSTIDSKSLIEQILTTRLRESMGLVVNSLPAGQVVDLWKTLHHNLDVECIQRISKGSDNSNVHNFLSIVTELFVEFLMNAKVVDYSVPSSTVERITEMLVKLRDDCLKPLGAAVLQRTNETEIVRPFLGLAYAWAELNGVLTWYNPKYKLKLNDSDEEEITDATNLSYLHPYIEPKDWIKLCKNCLANRDYGVTSLVVRLVAQKLKYMTGLEQSKSILSITNEKEDKLSEEEDETKSDMNLKLVSTAEFIWTHQNSINFLDMKETLTLVAEYVNPQHLIELAGNFVKQLQLLEETSDLTPEERLNNHVNPVISSGNPRFHYALVLEALGEVMRRIGKMKLLSKSIKSILNDALSLQNRAELLSLPLSRIVGRVEKGKQQEQPRIVSNLLKDVNKLIEEIKFDGSPKKYTQEFSSILIDGMLTFLCSLELENYPKELKTIVFLSSIVILLALMEQKTDDNVLNGVARIVTVCCSNSQGNEVMFGVKWIDLFKWLIASKASSRLDNKVQKELCESILGNIYLSSKLVAEFEEKELNGLLSENVKLNSDSAHVALNLMEFLVKELKKTKGSSKLSPQMKNHTRKLIQFILPRLEESGLKSSKKLKKRSSVCVEAICSNVFRGLWLSRFACEILGEGLNEDFKPVLNAGIDYSFMLINSSVIQSPEVRSSLIYGMKFLQSVCKAEDLRSELTGDLRYDIWQTCWSNLELWQQDMKKRCNDPIIPLRLIRDLYETAKVEEFQRMCLKLLDLMDNSGESNLQIVAYLMEEMLEAELAAEKKPHRRKTVEEYVHVMLEQLHIWNEEPDTLHNSVIPYLQFQIKLLRRRNAMISLNSLSICLTSVTSVPMSKIKDVKLFRKVFCTVADLLNAFAVHRLDVLSFRTHVYLQCFQYMIESLAKKADQNNKLADEEIYDLRHCAHSIERVCQSMKLGQKEFSRVSPYFVAVLMRQFELFTVYPSVKNSLQNGVYKLLDLCDEHGVAQLNSMLTIGSREIFKTVYDLYKKYYKYKGRV